jgi:hypothetical protein
MTVAGPRGTFAKACREADAKRRRKPCDARIEKLRRLMADDVSLERAHVEIINSRGVATATLAAAEFLIQQKDPERFRTWLAKHSASERAATLRHLEHKRRKQ